MSNIAHDVVGQAGEAVHEAAERAAPWVERLARLGFVAKGVVFAIIGLLALAAAVRAEGRITDQHGAMQTILAQPLGRAMLGVVAVGLAGYALWRLIQAIFNPEGAGDGFELMMKRIVRFVSGVVYGSLSLAAWELVFHNGLGGEGGEQRTRDWTARLMNQPGGTWLVAAVGLVMIGAGLWQLYLAWKARIGEHMSFGRMSAPLQRWVIRFGRVGAAARGVVFALIGVFLMIAADRHDADQARGVGGALAALERVSYGPAMLGVVAAGLIAYGIFQLFEARYRKIEIV